MSIKKDLETEIEKSSKDVDIKDILKEKLPYFCSKNFSSYNQFKLTIWKLDLPEFSLLVDCIRELIDNNAYYNCFNTPGNYLEIFYNIVQQEKYNKEHGN